MRAQRDCRLSAVPNRRRPASQGGAGWFLKDGRVAVPRIHSTSSESIGVNRKASQVLTGGRCSARLWIARRLGTLVRLLGTLLRRLGTKRRPLGTGQRHNPLIKNRISTDFPAKTLKTQIKPLKQLVLWITHNKSPSHRPIPLRPRRLARFARPGRHRRPPIRQPPASPQAMQKEAPYGATYLFTLHPSAPRPRARGTVRRHVAREQGAAGLRPFVSCSFAQAIEVPAASRPSRYAVASRALTQPPPLEPH